MTCAAPQGGKRDILFHVLYGGQAGFVARLIEESVINLGQEYRDFPGVVEALQNLRPCEDDSLCRLQVWCVCFPGYFLCEICFPVDQVLRAPQ
jgi:hypothetical protein